MVRLVELGGGRELLLSLDQALQVVEDQATRLGRLVKAVQLTFKKDFELLHDCGEGWGWCIQEIVLGLCSSLLKQLAFTWLGLFQELAQAQIVAVLGIPCVMRRAKGFVSHLTRSFADRLVVRAGPALARRVGPSMELGIRSSVIKRAAG